MAGKGKGKGGNTLVGKEEKMDEQFWEENFEIEEDGEIDQEYNTNDSNRLSHEQSLQEDTDGSDTDDSSSDDAGLGGQKPVLSLGFSSFLVNRIQKRYNDNRDGTNLDDASISYTDLDNTDYLNDQNTKNFKRLKSSGPDLLNLVEDDDIEITAVDDSAAVEYLLSVRKEAKKLPSVVSKEITKKQRKQSNHLHNPYQIYFEKFGNSHSSIPHIPSDKENMFNQNLKEYVASIHKVLMLYRHNLLYIDPTGEREPSNNDVPKVGEVLFSRSDSNHTPTHNLKKAAQIFIPSIKSSPKVWQRFLYGGKIAASASTSKKNAQNSEKSKSDKISINSDGTTSITPTEPTTSILIRLEQASVLTILEMHLHWMKVKSFEFTYLHSQWLFALFTRLDSLLDSKHIFIIRELGVLLQEIRSSIQSDLENPDDDHDINYRNQQIKWLTLLISIINTTFGQSDII